MALPGGTVTIPFANVAALDALIAAPANVTGPPSPQNWTIQAYANDIEAQTSGIYWQHTMDLVPNWFELITGWTWDNVATQSVPNWAVLPWQGTNISVSQWTHRYGGAVLHPDQVGVALCAGRHEFPDSLGCDIAEWHARSASNT